MATFENTVIIGRPIEEVFGFLADFENIPKWNYAIVETHKVYQGPVGVGTIYQQVRSVPSRSQERFEVTTYNPPRHLEIQGQLGPFPSRLTDTASEAVKKSVQTCVPLGRAGEPQDIEGLVVFLASRASSYVNGVTIPLDGGYLAAL